MLVSITKQWNPFSYTSEYAWQGSLLVLFSPLSFGKRARNEKNDTRAWFHNSTYKKRWNGTSTSLRHLAFSKLSRILSRHWRVKVATTATPSRTTSIQKMNFYFTCESRDTLNSFTLSLLFGVVLQRTANKCTKNINAYRKLLSFSLNLLFSDVLVAVGVVVFLNSLIARLRPRKFIFSPDTKSNSLKRRHVSKRNSCPVSEGKWKTCCLQAWRWHKGKENLLKWILTPLKMKGEFVSVINLYQVQESGNFISV